MQHIKPRVNYESSFVFLLRLISALSMVGFILPLCSSDPVKEVKCKHSNVQWNYLKGILHSCRIDSQKIDDRGYTISSSSNASVDVLDIQNTTDIKFIPENIADKFPQLIVLQVINCSVETISDKNFKNLRKLKYLHLPLNQIDVIERNAFKDLVKLEWLSLFHNQIEYVSSQLFASLESLKFLHLGENRIEVLCSKVFHPLKKLEVLNLKKNQIHYLHETILDNLPNLRNVSLSNNNFNGVNEKLFDSNKKLEFIWLHGNFITSINSKMFDNLSNLKYLNMENNTCVNKMYAKKTFNRDAIRIDLKTNCQPTKMQLEACMEQNQKLDQNLMMPDDNHL